MLVLHVTKDVEDALDGTGVAGDVHEVAGHEWPEGHDTPCYCNSSVYDEERANSGGCWTEVWEHAVRG